MDTDTLIIGASSAGLACAACLRKKGLKFLIVDQLEDIGSVWVNRYTKLRLHTPKRYSALPFFDFPKDFPDYVSKNDYADYLKQYATAFSIQPLFDCKVLEISHADGCWQITSAMGKITCRQVIIATGLASKPLLPHWDGIHLYEGEIIHSSVYQDGRQYKNKKVLVVGFGNSACEIVQCLYAEGSRPCLSVRSAVNIIPRDLFGIPIINIVIAELDSLGMSISFADHINAPLLKMLYGNLEKYGLKKLPFGPLEQVKNHKKIPLLDTGIVKLIRSGNVSVNPGIKSIRSNGVEFVNGSKEDFDVIIAATGYTTGISSFLKTDTGVLDEKGLPLVSGKESGMDGLFFCGFYVSARGMLREIGKEAKEISNQISKRQQHTPVLK